MAHHQDTPKEGRGFWGCANIILGIFFAGFAAIAGGALIFGGAAGPGPKYDPAKLTAGDGVDVTIKPGAANPMSYDVTTINAKEGQTVRITFVNQHPAAPLQHNIIVCKPGSKDAIVAAANNMMTDMPKWLAKGFIPESPDVLHHTKLVDPGKTEVLEFTAGAPGDYPYLCTFPGHTMIMQGTLKVTKKE